MEMSNKKAGQALAAGGILIMIFSTSVCLTQNTAQSFTFSYSYLQEDNKEKDKNENKMNSILNEPVITLLKVEEVTISLYGRGEAYEKLLEESTAVVLQSLLHPLNSQALEKSIPKSSKRYLHVRMDIKEITIFHPQGTGRLHYSATLRAAVTDLKNGALYGEAVIARTNHTSINSAPYLYALIREALGEILDYE